MHRFNLVLAFVFVFFVGGLLGLVAGLGVGNRSTKEAIRFEHDWCDAAIAATKRDCANGP